MLQRFNGGATPEALAKLNAIVDELNALGGLRGDQFIQFVRGPGGANVSLNIQAVQARIPKLVADNGDVIAVVLMFITNQTLSGIPGGLADGDLVFCQNQTSAAAIGVYTVHSGAWTGFSQPKGVLVQCGATNPQTLWALSAANTYTEVGGGAAGPTTVSYARAAGLSLASSTVDGVALSSGDTMLLITGYSSYYAGLYTWNGAAFARQANPQPYAVIVGSEGTTYGGLTFTTVLATNSAAYVAGGYAWA